MWTRIFTIGLLLIVGCDVLHGQEFERRGRRDRGSRDGSDRDRGGFGGDRGRFGRGGPGGRSGFDPVGRMDANQNGQIDQEEIDRIPERFREMMKARGFELTAGESVDDVRERTRRRFEEERKRRESGRDSEDSESGRDNRSTPPPVFKPRDRERMTVDIPKDYADVDSDLDGQIGLYEWIVARREELELFDDMDRDSDGLLTPRELAAWDKAKSEAGKATFTVAKRERLLIVGGASDASASGKNGRPGESGKSKSERKEDKDRVRSYAQSTFGRMDRDQDGRISMEEWGNSRRIRPWFEGAGVEIRAMSEDEFTSTFARLSKAGSRR